MIVKKHNDCVLASDSCYRPYQFSSSCWDTATLKLCDVCMKSSAIDLEEQLHSSWGKTLCFRKIKTPYNNLASFKSLLNLSDHYLGQANFKHTMTLTFHFQEAGLQQVYMPTTLSCPWLRHVLSMPVLGQYLVEACCPVLSHDSVRLECDSRLYTEGILSINYHWPFSRNTWHQVHQAILQCSTVNSPLSSGIELTDRVCIAFTIVPIEHLLRPSNGLSK